MGIEYMFYVGLFLSVLLGNVFLASDTATATEGTTSPPEEDDTSTPPTDDDSDDPVDPEPETPSDPPINPAEGATENSLIDDLFNANLYSRVETLTDQDDRLAANDATGAWFLEAGNDTMTTSSGRDFVGGGEGNDDIAVLAGDDIAFGGAGNDTLLGGVGNDLLYGDADNDLLNGEIGADTLYGDAGNDTLLGGDGSDVLTGGDGDDYLSGYLNSLARDATTVDGADTLFGGAGNDILHLGRLDVATGGAGADTFRLDYRDATSDNAITVLDFDPTLDEIELWFTPRIDGSAPTFTVAPVGDTTYQILQDGEIVALVTSTNGALTQDMLSLVPIPLTP